MNLKRFERRTRNCNEKKNKISNYAYLNRNYCLKGQTVIAGDSITEFFNFYELFASYREQTGLQVYNRGISGDFSNRLIERLESNVLCLEPRNVVYLIGINDIHKGADNPYIRDNIKKIIELTREKCPDCNIFVQSVYPIVDSRTRKNSQVLPLNVLIKELCAEEGITYIDVHDLLTDGEGKFSSEYTYDGLHPNVEGYEVVVKEIIKVLK